ncbi:major facilitator superfamily MFS_1 [Pseudarthrobacter chlorophenolicus A6]|uniref:Major facilitator superfamily MFS_1 n=1 Tax=Pseudarthrobacter chlorophenolicus (strain ATCC 700700 / DSM 12829 / CIP 107037 / JCM 12360 / KCTC 9906 / NCIMB 13794 / A6) TaxID=452863 RepID=B8HD56_PSECP|nr:MFS transporter [Pseudarthrobacter chlorophenolicus]ACL40702.1 major facilitator superfamily MFS_1 [Pseudarthrobacter chlorophenolicus A6]SDQ76618.1 Fucose permease [Pseudarthrobacter chlorophenolicus]
MTKAAAPHATAAGVTHWRNAVVVAYGASGLAFASWVSRLPAIRDALDLTPGNVGVLLLCLTLGSFASVSASGLIVLRLGSKQTIRTGSIMVGFGLLLAGLGTSVLASPVATAAGLAVIGLGTGSWNTASNVEGAAVERAVGRHIMPRLHGAFSLGTVAGAGLGAAAAAVSLPVALHLGAAGLVVAVSVATAASWFRADITAVAGERTYTPDHFEDPTTGPIPLITAGEGEAPLDNKRKIAQAWRDRRTLLLGVLVLGLALAEGAAGDWVALALADGHGQSDAAGAAGYGLFVTFMTIGRFAGTLVLDRYGRVPVMRWCAALAVLGLGLFVFAPVPWLAFIGLAIWGLGASLGFPVGMSAAADDPAKAAARVSVVSTIGYGAFLCGPPLLGLLAEHVGILHSLLAVMVMLAVSFFLSPVARKLG